MGHIHTCRHLKRSSPWRKSRKQYRMLRRNKAPKLDSFPIFFFRMFRDIVKVDILRRLGKYSKA